MVRAEVRIIDMIDVVHRATIIVRGVNCPSKKAIELDLSHHP